MIEWYWLVTAFACGFLLLLIVSKRRIDLSSTLDLLSVNYSGYKSNMERHKDFNSTFLTSERGRRVLQEILEWGHQNKAIRETDPYKLAHKNGERTLAIKILTTVHAEPKELPKQTKA